MIANLIDYIVLFLLKKELINARDIELYKFGVSKLVLFCINITTTIVIGLLFGMLWESTMFSLAYIPLRRFAGGYHAKTPIRCYFQSIILILSVLFLIRAFTKNYLIGVLVILMSTWTILKKAPMGCKQRKLSSKEIVVFKKKTRKILILEFVCFFTILIIDLKTALSIGMAIVCTAIMLLISE